MTPRCFAPLLLLALLAAPLLPRSAAAQDAPPHESEGFRPRKAAAPHKAVAPHNAQAAKAAKPAARPAVNSGKKATGRKTARGPAVKNDGKPYLRSLDKNHDGRVSHEEFVAGSKKRFRKADANHDGVVSPQEARAAKAKLLEKQAKRDAKRRAEGKPVKVRRKSNRPPKPYLATFDKNKDGRVTQKEYLERREKKFVEMDLNHDGVVSREEARIAKEKVLKLREQRKAEAKERRLRKIAEAKAKREAAGTMSSPGPELTAPVTPPPAPKAAADPDAGAAGNDAAKAPAKPAKTPAVPENLPLTPIAPSVPAKAEPAT
ncbi:MAG: hypothetical protein AUJ49_10880 [Desulfovibrionaceae bacterium CG1_02_65_16]|nr:MAG: hypothetical protein AUJ49_10880 [Desulfovibrionaceae bacterium CG1_02_65_16]